MASEGNDGKLAQFQDITGTDGDRATFFLESANWDLEMALGSFYENSGEDAEPMQTSRDPEPEKPASERQPPPAAPAQGGRGVGANVGTLYSGHGEDSESDSEEEQGQAFYAGGSSTSGQQILGPPKKKGGSDFVKDLFKKAREHGAEAVEAGSSRGGAAGSSAFTGTGFKLGSSESNPSEQVQGKKVAKPPREFILKMWKNGFSIDDGELRPYNDPQNRAFLSSVMTGRIPDELVHMAEGGEVHVDMEDHKEEEFVKPKGSRKAFAGSGHVLGGVAPGVQESASAAATVSASAPAPAPAPDAEKKAQSDLSVDPDMPTTSVQIRLPDGKRLIAKVNHSHTVGDVRRFVSNARPDYLAFSLHTTYPPKELADDKATIKDAGLIGAAILLRQK